jgi:Ca2+-transporting ATPase
MNPWCESPEQVADALEVSLQEGLTEKEAARRLAEDGPNELAQQKGRTLFQKFIDQFKNFLVLVLAAAAIISGVVGMRTGEGLADTFIILGIVILNAVLGVIQESKAEASLEALKQMAAPNAKVIREGRMDVVPARTLVAGDLVVLETGDFVPADLRLIEAANLKIQEAALTGESVPVEKHIAALDDEETPLGDRVNMAFSGSLVTYGRGRGIVTHTGMRTQMGRIAEMLKDAQDQDTPMKKRMESLGKTLGLAALIICAVIFGAGVWYGKEIITMFMTSVSLAVAAIPEGLPAVVTVVMAIGVTRLAKRNAIIRKLPAVETLGSATVICSDKTGTLTLNQMTVTRYYYDDAFYEAKEIGADLPEPLERLMTVSMLCNDARVHTENGERKMVGDPTETALVAAGLDLGLSKEELEQGYPRVAEVPFDSDRKLMSTIHEHGNRWILCTKGAVDELLTRCDRILTDGAVRPLTDGDRERILDANFRMAADALRVLGGAYRELGVLPGGVDDSIENGLIFAGMLGMIDPPRPEAREAVRLCRQAGIKPVMITGDHKITAVAIAKSLGILEEEGEAVTGAELSQMDDETLRQRVRDIAVYARVSPEHKVRIVRAWQSHGQIVAMTGDGVNDAPALKQADIGAAMGKVGTDVAKEAADMVLADDNFATIVAAVREGRIIFANILKSIQFLLSCNVGEILLLFVATMVNWEEPLLPIHILWVNLVTDSLPALALGVDPAEAGIMDRRPRDPKRGIFDRGMLARILYQGIMVGGLALIAFVIGEGWSLAVGRTMSFAVLALSQLVHVFNVRSNTRSVFSYGFLSNPQLAGAVLLSAVLQILVICIPALSGVFRVVQLTGVQWLWVALLSVAPLVIVELVKLAGFNGNKGEDK